MINSKEEGEGWRDRGVERNNGGVERNNVALSVCSPRGEWNLTVYAFPHFRGLDTDLPLGLALSGTYRDVFPGSRAGPFFSTCPQA